MAQEIELKLSLPEAEASRLWRCKAVKAFVRSPRRTSTLHNIYFDTANASLWRKRFALRLRRQGRSWVQTLKGGGTVQPGLHERDELETPVRGCHLDFGVLLVSSAGKLLARSKVRDALVPRFETRFRRSRCDVELAPGTTAELCLDRGEIVAGTRNLPLCEIEVELTKGERRKLFEFALALADELPIRLEFSSKAERGYALALGREATPVRAQPVHLDAAMTPRQAMRATVWSCLGQLAANETGLLSARDPEYLHQARVALRRLRAALSVFASEFPETRDPELFDELRWLDANLGPARDWDVFLLETIGRTAPDITHAPALSRIKARAHSRRRAARKHAIDAVASGRYTRLTIRLAQAMLDESPVAANSELLNTARPLTALAAEVIEKRYQKVQLQGARAKQNDLATLHRLRIDIKKLRYAVEFYRDLYPRKKFRPFVLALAQLQEDLGGLNDAAMADAMCTLLRKEGDPAEMSEVLGQVRGWWAAAAREKLTSLPQRWQTFADIKRFWFTS